MIKSHSLILRIVLLLLLIGFVSGFVSTCSGLEFLGVSTRQAFADTKTCSSPARRQLQQELFASPASTTYRNIFHDYNGPIVLIGCSGPGKELERLANYLSTNNLARGSSKVEPLSSGTLQSLDNKEYGWPDILLLDLATAVGEDDVKTTLMKDMAQHVYEKSNLLSIYVNVESSSLSDTQARLKARIEDDVLVRYSDYEICIRDEGKLTVSNDDNDDDAASASAISNWEHIEWEMTRILARARLIPAIPGDKERSENTAHLTMGQNTFFLSLSFPEITQVQPYVEKMCQDVDAMEYRADLLDCRDSRFDLLYGMQLLRRYCRPHAVRVPALPCGGTVIEDVVPILYTVRTQNQSGTYPDDERGISKMFEMLQWGLRAGVEVLDVESAWDPEKTNKLLDRAEERYTSQILGSHHVVGKEVTTEEAVELFEQCAMNGRAHGAKVVLSIESEERDRMAYEAALISSELAASEGAPVIPKISLILGEVGQFSRIINLPFTPVTHESLPFTAAPGQLTASEIMTTRLLTRIFTPRKFAILGHNIAYSVSPQMHGAAFSATQLPNVYVRADVETVEEFIESTMFKSDDFGGTSVTIPHKQAIIPYVDVLSEAAETIGSVNTLIAKTEFEDDGFKRVIYGDNTDWKGIFNPLNRLLGGSVKADSDYALILGAGGTARAAAYVAKKLDLKRIYYNRTPSKAEDLAESFGGTVVTSLDKGSVENGQSLGDVIRNVDESRLRVVISTLPAASDFVLPEWLLADESSKPIIFDVNYKPYYTKLLSQAEEAGCSMVRGSEMLWEQGVGQFELWTDRTAPYSVMKQVVLQNCLETAEKTTSDEEPEPVGVFE